MNILLTNDDGIKSEGILKLAEALRKKRNDYIYVLAPDTDRSGISHGLTILFNPMKLTEVSKDTWSCPGTPADCVVLAVLGAFSFKPDLIVYYLFRDSCRSPAGFFVRNPFHCPVPGKGRNFQLGHGCPILNRLSG
jgi:hypothetical protein